jgi:predicted RNase H-like HicB family nuclease
MDFRIFLEKDEDGWYIATVPALPGCISQGKTEEDAKRNIAEAIELHLKAMARDGIPLTPTHHIIETSVSVQI